MTRTADTRATYFNCLRAVIKNRPTIRFREVLRTTVFAACATFLVISVYAESLHGSTGSAAQGSWQSSWLDLNPPMSFKKGEKLRIKVEGKAENVVLRLLPVDSDPSSPDGIEGKVRKVPATGTLEVTLESDHPNVKQISVHGGKTAWDISLGGNNGSVKLVSIERIVK